MRLETNTGSVKVAGPVAVSPTTVLTPQQRIEFLENMLGQLKEQATECDWMLAHFIEIAHLQAIDLRNGVTAPQRRRPSK